MMLYIESPSTNPYFNLALEEYIFESLDRTQDYFMLWQNENTIVVGKYQNTAEEVNDEAIVKNKIRVVRRLSGGGAVYHDKGNLNYTFITDKNNNPDFNFRLFASPVVDALKRMGVEAEFSDRNDLTIEGKKFSGNAQYSKNNRVMHHGCIMLNSNLERVSDALRVKEAKFESKGIKSVRSRVTTINAHTLKPFSMKQFKQLLLSAVSDRNVVENRILDSVDLESVVKLQQTKYETWEWNYGASPDYDVRHDRKFPQGLITAHMNVSDGRIKSIRFYGDFFGNGDLSKLENEMINLPLDDYLEEALKSLNIGHYMNGITASDICKLIR
jgi:lipoate-protein ligase A